MIGVTLTLIHLSAGELFYYDDDDGDDDLEKVTVVIDLVFDSQTCPLFGKMNSLYSLDNEVTLSRSIIT